MAGLRLPFVSSLANAIVSLQKEPISTPAPFKLTRRRTRKNHLRLKILKKPQTEILFPEPFPESPTIQFQTPSPDLSDPFLEQDANQGTTTDTHQQQQSQYSSDRFVELDPNEGTTETIGVPVGGSDAGGVNTTFSTRSVVKVGMYLVAAFLFQTVFAVLVFRPDGYERDDRRLDDVNEKEVEGNSSMGVDESEMGKKVFEIQAMARAARVKERLEFERNRADSDEVIRTGIGKEVDNKLVNVRTRLQKSPVKLPLSMPETDQDQETSNLGDSENLLMFEKKYKFKNSSAKPDNKPLGFRGFSNNGKSGRIGDELNGSHKSRRKGKPVKPAIANRRKVEESDQMKNGIAESRKQNRELDDNKDDDLWWLKLPYVMAVFMHGREEGEGPEGLFSIKLANSSDMLSSHTVAFEDRGDAINFCYILQSFFGELNDFNADILPLPVKELEVEVKSKKMKVIVVKKGQLKLYAGQSLSEVESALHSLVK
ncbi:uncharacterized protein LOC124912535 [Impatiens glandulifera]|uniref:uncharacterized protein LOC124912535 n=1 Tax=Impatiens glandulifera TaxID=253017 RepID=UPI001FB12ACE|nr:uncharacterized protein LOC124912535 [Impatiens glandulifera]